MKCPNCHKKVADDSVFCPFCGNKIELEIECPKCKTKNTADSLYCKKCGTFLKEKVEASQEKEENKKSKTLKWLLSIIAMSTMFLSIVLMFGLIFSPMLFSSFFDSGDYTIISWASNVLKIEIDELFETNRYFDFANSIISLALLGSVVISAIVIAAVNVPKLIKNIKAKTYFDFSKPVVALFVLFAATYVYFAKFAVSQTPNYYDGIGIGVLSVFIIVPIFFVFNMFVKEFIEEKHNLTKLIIRSVSRTIIFIFAFIVITNIGGTKLLITASFKKEGNVVVNTYGKFGNAEFFRFVLENLLYIYPSADKYLNPAVIFSVVALVSELLVLIFGAMILCASLKGDKKNRPNYFFASVLSIVILAGPILNVISNSSITANLNKINDIQTYGCAFNTSSLNSNASISSIVLISLLIVNCIACIFIDKKEVEKDEETK